MIVVAQARKIAGSLYRYGVFHLLLSASSIHGIAYVSQLCLAKMLSPTDFGIMRTVEAYLNVLVIIGSIGMPSLAVIVIARTPQPRQRARLLAVLMQIALTTGLICSLLCVLLLPLLSLHAVGYYLGRMAWIVALTAAGRTGFYYFQGIKKFQFASILNFISAIFSFSLLLTLSYLFGLRGWVIGKYFGESLFLVMVLFLVRRRISFKGPLPKKFKVPAILAMGAPIAYGLVLRSYLDSADIFALNYFMPASPAIGVYALSWVLVFSLYFLPGVVITLSAPRIAERLEDPVGVWAYLKKVIRTSALVSIAVTVGLILFRSAVVWVFGQKYHAALNLIPVLSLVILPRTLATAYGTFLLALGKTLPAAVANTLLSGLALALYFYSIPRYGTMGAAFSTLTMEIVSLGLFYQMAHWERAAMGKGSRL